MTAVRADAERAQFWYGAVAAVRIQTWLSSVSSNRGLRLLRGGSELLQHATTQLLEYVDGVDDVEVANDAGRVSGVVPLRGPDRASLAAALEEIMARAKLEVPRLEWTSWLARGATYAAAFDAAAEAEPYARGLPSLLDFPGTHRCPGCQAEPAARSDESSGDEQARYGVDCALRDERSTPERPRSGPRQPSDFDELAKVGGLAEGDELEAHDVGNELATICADGNNVGALMRKLTTADPGVVASITTGLNDVTAHAAERATYEVARDALIEPAVIHFCGGDDLFASVAARHAWRWLLAFDRNFRDGMTAHADELAETGVDADIVTAARSLSVSAGITFADSAHPIADARHLAEEALRYAKRRERGRHAAVNWLDLNVESRPEPSRVLLLSDLHPRSGTPEYGQAVLALNPTRRKTLERLLSESADLDVLLRWADRVGSSDIGTYATGTPDWWDGLRTQIALARWWPTTNREGST